MPGPDDCHIRTEHGGSGGTADGSGSGGGSGAGSGTGGADTAGGGGTGGGGAPTTFGGELLAGVTPALPESTLTHVRTVPARPAAPVDLPAWTTPGLRAALDARGVDRLYSHQAETAELARAGHDVVVSTGTASGKSLAYQLPVLTALTEEPTASALYIAPTKALAQDQRRSLVDLCRDAGLTDVMVATYDGDTPPEARRTIREESRLIVTNPDMLHASVLGNPARWTRLLRTLRYVVVDECHVYRGVFGAHVSLVLRRLLRLTGADPTLILASATTADPAGHAARLTGRDVTAVTTDGSPQGERTVALWEPGFLPDVVGEHGAPVRRAATTESADIMARLIAQGARTLTFVRSRRGAELVALACAETLGTLGRPGDARRVAAYRAGYTPEDRRDLERRLDDGDLLGVATTNALELGIDVGGLDAVVCAGFPGTVASFRQQAGRAGRRGQGALVVMVGSDDPMDTYLVHHPEALLDRPVEASVFDPSNPYVLADHVVCAAAERPLADGEIAAWGAEGVVDTLIRRGVLRRRPRGVFCATVEIADRSHGRVNLRGGTGDAVVVVDGTTGAVLGTVDTARAVADVHTGAVYVHQGESYVVDTLDLDELIAVTHPDQPEWYTTTQRDTSVAVLRARRTVPWGPGVWLADVDVQVTHRVTGYQRRLPGGEVLETVPLDLPPTDLRTRAVAYTVEPEALFAAGVEEPLWPGALHAAEHAAIGLLPLLATCDRWDIGGLSTVLHPDTGLPTVFVYDGYAGGAGFAECGFRRFGEWMRATADAVEACPCESGCPSCIQSPKCGNGNDPLFKAGAVAVLRTLAAQDGGRG
ncbi:DEAD/DEAH box helicase [Corynebacterium bovis]|uniref:DEAD/DEAH box helicase domain-containing protein n=6 Tax=Corynebacterium bovis TaxID=36808 RepID=A0A8H9Y918_9CORY|nr:DEAD/DEAH box helicase [Corynebacterium bovis]MBB3116913.1 DEAD/DEAH box helicase domain-containing protein [Corynebacterium bovis DSM 20582 = CIP 54.80]RRO80419.1 DEAD/DEAH box helicase [Corynebacterium bovis]RRO83459.1 DEAD/DEAH box helicase [Corynebacterium bovis]RRQ13472.1 DEAD/DEAH box helicase [Corynebacterium bovis]RRQ17308.1 DEAD/DEAH box helicase [Corynebacterium bovis]